MEIKIKVKQGRENWERVRPLGQRAGGNEVGSRASWLLRTGLSCLPHKLRDGGSKVLSEGSLSSPPRISLPFCP